MGLKSAFWRHPGHLVWILAAYLPFLWEFSVPFTVDQKAYISIAMEMRERGEWLQPYLFGEPNYLKPPLQYWMTLLSWNVFGFNTFATFLPGVLALIGTAWFLNEIAYLLGERKWVVNSGLWFAISAGTMAYALSAQMDIWVCLFYSGAWWAGLRFLEDIPETRAGEERKVVWLYVAFLIAGLSAIVKNPAYSVFWVSGYLIYLLISGEWLLFKNRHLYLGLFSGIALGLCWFIILWIRDGEAFWEEYLLQEKVANASKRGDLGDLWFPMFYMTFPFTLLLITAIRSAWMGRRTAGILRFVLAWSIPPALFFSFFPHRAALYVFILVPALAVLVDWGCFRASRTRTFRWSARATGVLMALALSLFGYALYQFEFVQPWLMLAIVFAGVAGAIILWFGKMRLFTLAALAGLLFCRIGLIDVMRSDQMSLREALGGVGEYDAAMLDEGRNPWHEIGLLSVGIGQPMRRLFGYDDVMEHLLSGGSLILSEENAYKYRQTLTTAMAERGGSLEWKKWKRYKRRHGVPVKDVLLRGRGNVPELDAMISREFEIVRLEKK